MNWDKVQRACILIGLCLGVITLRVEYYIAAPVLLDFFRITSFPLGNLTDNSTGSGNTSTVLPLASEGISALFLLIGQYGFATLGSGLLLVILILVQPGFLTETDRRHSKRRIFIMAFCMTLSSLGFNYALSGTRTPPYLQAILGNFNIPIQFTMR